MFTDILYIWSTSRALSVAIWLVISITVLYMGREHAHQLLRSTGRLLHNSLRTAAVSLRQLEQRVANRNRDVLLAMGRDSCEKAIEREFIRVHSIVERELSQYPALHRQLLETLEKVEADYQASTEGAPLPPAWSEVLDTIGNLPQSGDPAMVKVLDNIRHVVENSHQQTLKAYQKSAGERHRLLKAMQPEWRALGSTMEKVHQTITGLDGRAKAIDNQMASYESMRKGEDKAVNALTSSSLTQFFIASLVLVIAVFGGIINFHLIALPMSEMVGGASYIGAVRTSDIAALVIIMVEITMGLFLLEALQITRLFPVISSMDDTMRKRLAIAALTILVLFASIEASLAYMRDLLALDREALQQSLAGVAVAEAQFRWIPSVGQLALGFILPFALAFVGIPLESFIHSLRTVLGLLVLGVLRIIRVSVRLSAGIANHLSKILINLYDVFVMIPLSIERMVRGYRDNRRQQVDMTDDAETDSAAESRPGRDNKPNRATRRQQSLDNDDAMTLTVREA